MTSAGSGQPAFRWLPEGWEHEPAPGVHAPETLPYCLACSPERALERLHEIALEEAPRSTSKPVMLPGRRVTMPVPVVSYHTGPDGRMRLGTDTGAAQELLVQQAQQLWLANQQAAANEASMLDLYMAAGAKPTIPPIKRSDEIVTKNQRCLLCSALTWPPGRAGSTACASTG